MIFIDLDYNSFSSSGGQPSGDEFLHFIDEKMEDWRD